MSCDKEYVCVDCGMTYEEDDWWSCQKCNTAVCPKCGGEIVTTEEYEKGMQEMHEEF
jgi:DNA-directed RNA polymerase subunit RPC12/RpoP